MTKKLFYRAREAQEHTALARSPLDLLCLYRQGPAAAADQGWRPRLGLARL